MQFPKCSDRRLRSHRRSGAPIKTVNTSLLNVRNTMTSDCLKNCSKLRCGDHITADTEGRKTKGCLQTNPETWGFQMFPEEEMQDIREHGNHKQVHASILPPII
ncbi:hypothetical protein TNCV_440931 [Trichonephila clavipes]|nr:hypothetical protein TNCV_440931 [Trichonephila clavipes]